MNRRRFVNEEASEEAGSRAEETGRRSTYLFSFFFICWPWSQVRTRSNHFCDGERRCGLGNERKCRPAPLPSALSPSPPPGLPWRHP